MLAQLQGPSCASANLALVYITDHFASHATELLAHLVQALPHVGDWAGTVGVGVAANGVEYFDEPAIGVMLCSFPVNSHRVFSGVAPLGSFVANTALVHADASTLDLSELVDELAQRTASACVFGGLSASRSQPVQMTLTARGGGFNGGVSVGAPVGGVFTGGLSGVGFGIQVNLMSRVTQGCQALAPARRITACDGHVLLKLDGQNALDCLSQDLKLNLREPDDLLKLRSALVGIEDPHASADHLSWKNRAFAPDTRVRHLIGIDPSLGAVAIAEPLALGQRLWFGERNVQAARTDLTRMCTELRDALEGQTIQGAIYVSCAGRGGPHFGGPNAELQIVRRALGDVPLIGFFASGEIAHRHIHGYSAVLTVFWG